MNSQQTHAVRAILELIKSSVDVSNTDIVNAINALSAALESSGDDTQAAIAAMQAVIESSGDDTQAAIATAVTDLKAGLREQPNDLRTLKHTITASTRVLMYRSGYRQVLVHVDGPVYVIDDKGPIVDGVFEWRNEMALDLTPVSGTVNVRILEEF